MAFSIEEFKANGLEFGGARPNLFKVQLFFPNAAALNNLGVTAPAQDVGYKAQFMCMASALPAGLIEPVNVPYFGRIVKYKGDRIFRDWQITVLNDEDFLVRDAFEAWQNSMNYLESNVMDPAYQPRQGYKVDSIITQYAKDDNPTAAPGDLGRPIKDYTMIGCWPTQVGEIQVSWNSRNEIETFDVTLTYDYWLPFATVEGLATAVSI